MSGDALRKVRTGEPLRIPAAAYNAFVDAAIANRASERNAIADPGRDPSQRDHLAMGWLERVQGTLE